MCERIKQSLVDSNLVVKKETNRTILKIRGIETLNE